MVIGGFATKKITTVTRELGDTKFWTNDKIEILKDTTVRGYFEGEQNVRELEVRYLIGNDNSF